MKDKQRILFIWDKLKTTPSTGKYFVFIGLCISSEVLLNLGNIYLAFVLLLILVFEILKYLWFLAKPIEVIDIKDIERAKRIYDLLEEDEN